MTVNTTDGDFSVSGTNKALISSSNVGTDAIQLNASAGNIDIDGSNGVNIDGADNSNFTITANDAANKALTLSATNADATGEGNIDISADDNIILDAADGIIDINSAAGNINIGNDNVNGAINVGTSGTRTVTLGNNNSHTKVDGSLAITSSTEPSVTGAYEITVGARSFIAISMTGTTTLSLTTGTNSGQMLVLLIYTFDTSLTMPETATLRLAGPWAPDSNGDTITLIWDGTNWNELYRSDN